MLLFTASVKGLRASPALSAWLRLDRRDRYYEPSGPFVQRWLLGRPNHPTTRSSQRRQPSPTPAMVRVVRFDARYLIDRLVHTRSRADELLSLRARFAHIRRPPPSEQELRLALQMRQLRCRIAEAIGRPRSCASCARGYPAPNGQWPGGYCCGTDTWRVFTDDELAALAASGTRIHRLEPPRCEHAGCVFRGPTGCSIDPADRPNICARYLCVELIAELRTEGRLKPLDRLCRTLTAHFTQFTNLRAQRLEREAFDALEQALHPGRRLR